MARVASGVISLRGVAVHNLKEVDLDIPRGKLIVLCGLSGSGKTSLALDTLYAEGQRRYIDSFSAYTRQFLERLEKPAAEQIEGIPPAIAVTHKNTSRSSRSTVGTATESSDYLRLLFAKIGQLFCHSCARPVRRETAQAAAADLARLPGGTKFLIAFELPPAAAEELETLAGALREQGFVRLIVGQQTINLGEIGPGQLSAIVSAAASESTGAENAIAQPGANRLLVVVDRLAAGGVADQRLRDSLETAFSRGEGRCHVLVEAADPAAAEESGVPLALDGRLWQERIYSTQLRCESCGIDYPELEPRLFSFNSPLGACPECEGFGNVMDIDMDLVVPDPSRSIRDGAIAPWNTPAYAHELTELLALADDHALPVDVPFSELDERQRALVVEGVPEREFGGLRGFFRWLERRKYKMHLRVFLSRWRSYHACPVCGGTRLRPRLWPCASAAATLPKSRS